MQNNSTFLPVITLLWNENLHLKHWGWKMSFLLGPGLLRGATGRLVSGWNHPPISSVPGTFAQSLRGMEPDSIEIVTLVRWMVSWKIYSLLYPFLSYFIQFIHFIHPPPQKKKNVSWLKYLGQVVVSSHYNLTTFEFSWLRFSAFWRIVWICWTSS